MSREARLVIVLVLNLALVAGLVVVGLTAHSLGVLAAGGDYLADAAAIGVSLLAIALSRRRPTSARPGGHPKATAIAAFVNGSLLLAVVVVVAVEAVRRLATGTGPVDGLPVLIASAIAAAVMFAGTLILRSDVDQEADQEGDRANVRAVLLDTAADAAAATGVAVTGAIILVSGRFYWLDPVVALVISVAVGYQALALLRDVLPVLRRPAPRLRL